MKGTNEIAKAYLLLNYIHETSQTNHPGPSHLALRAGFGNLFNIDKFYC